MDTNQQLACDCNNHAIRHINVSSTLVTTVAGNTTEGFADGFGTLATFGGGGVALGVAMDAAGTVALVSDNQNSNIRKIDLTTGEVTTLAGQLGISAFADGIGTLAEFNAPFGVALTGSGSFALVVGRAVASARLRVHCSGCTKCPARP